MSKADVRATGVASTRFNSSTGEGGRLGGRRADNRRKKGMLEALKDAAGENEKTENVSFESWWSMYPRKVARVDAIKAWHQAHPADRVLAFKKLPDHVKSWRANGTDKHHIPYPASWLRGQRFHDEIDVPAEMPQCDWNRNGNRDMHAGRCAEQAVKEGDGQFYCAKHCQSLGLRVVRG